MEVKALAPSRAWLQGAAALLIWDRGAHPSCTPRSEPASQAKVTLSSHMPSVFGPRRVQPGARTLTANAWRLTPRGEEIVRAGSPNCTPIPTKETR